MEELEHFDDFTESENPEHTEIFTETTNTDYEYFLMETTESEFTDILTDAGMIRVIHEITLGDMIIFVALALILSLQFIKWIINKIWG